MKQNSGILRADTFRYHGFDVSCVEPAPGGRICFGSFRGDTLFAKPTGEPIDQGEHMSPTCATVNGIAFIGASKMAVSTPNEVVFKTELEGKGPVRAGFPVGAHGVIGTKAGYFVAPLGPEGLMLVKPEGGANESVTVQRPAKRLNFYRAICISADDKEILVCAARTDGVSMNALLASEMGRATFPTLDMVDVCPVDTVRRSVIALSSSGSMAFFRDILNDQDPVMFSFDEIEGTAYRLLHTRGNLFLLTSSGMYQMQWQNGSSLPSLLRKIDFLAADCNLVGGDRYLGLVMPNGFLPIDLRFLLSEPIATKPRAGTSKPKKATRIKPEKRFKLQGWSVLARIRREARAKPFNWTSTHASQPRHSPPPSGYKRFSTACGSFSQ